MILPSLVKDGNNAVWNLTFTDKISCSRCKKEFSEGDKGYLCLETEIITCRRCCVNSIHSCHVRTDYMQGFANGSFLDPRTSSSHQHFNITILYEKKNKQEKAKVLKPDSEVLEDDRTLYNE